MQLSESLEDFLIRFKILNEKFQMNDDICKQILQFLSVKLTGKPMQIKHLPNNRINVYFGNLPLYYNAKIFETNGSYKRYARVLNDIIEHAARSPINVSIPCYNNYGLLGFKPVVPMNITFEQLLILKDLENLNDVE